MLLTAYNIIGESPASAPVEVFVGEAGKPWRRHPAAGSHGKWHGPVLSGPSSVRCH